MGNWQQQLDDNKNAFTEEFVTALTFLTALPLSLTPAQFVDTLNGNAKDNNNAMPLSAAERDNLVNALTNGTMTRAQVLRAVAEDADLANSEKNRAFVLMQYFGYLRRNPNDPQDSDYAGYEFWLGKLNAVRTAITSRRRWSRPSSPQTNIVIGSRRTNYYRATACRLNETKRRATCGCASPTLTMSALGYWIKISRFLIDFGLNPAGRD